jgi:5-methylcytosine-specific restriction endonuclease McrA
MEQRECEQARRDEIVRQEFTTKTRREALERSGGFCEGTKADGTRCNANLWQKRRIFDHIIPCALGGTNDLSNAQVLCTTCDDIKTDKKDIPTIAKAKRISDKHQGVKIKSRGFQKRPAQRTASRPIRRAHADAL